MEGIQTFSPKLLSCKKHFHSCIFDFTHSWVYDAQELRILIRLCSSNIKPLILSLFAYVYS
jgi:hypothetical protein